MDRDQQPKKTATQDRAPDEPRLDRRDPPGGRVFHPERKGALPDRQPEEPHGDSEAV